MNDDLKEIVRKHALKNAADYGKAAAGSVASKVFAEAPEAKRDVKATMKLVNEEVTRANALSKSEVEKELAKHSFVEKKEASESEKRFRLEGAVEGGVVTRFLPEPNGPAHIGHAKAAWLSAEAARQWKGKCLLRWDDTNPEKEKREFADAIRADLRWLGLEFARESFTSDLMPKLYEFAEKLVAQGDAYVCECSKEEIGKNREAKRACECRSRSTKENAALWRKMRNGETKEGEAILRLKANLESENTVMRDPSLFRVIEAPHFRQGEKYKAWPTYDFEVSISDSLDGVTHALRSKEYELRDELYYYIIDKLGLRKPVIYDFSRLEIKGTALSKRVLRPLIESGKVWGWDDPRLPTLAGLRRRGILPNVIREFVLSFGLSKVESEPSWTALLVANKRALDATAPHYFFVAEPVKLKVASAPARKIKIRKHPKLELGERAVDSRDEFFLSREDAVSLKKGEIFRLKESYNVKAVKKSKAGLEGEYAGEELIPESKKIQWVAVNEALDAELVIVGDLLNERGEFNEKSLSVRKGKCEAACAQLRRGDVVQFERVGYAILDDEAKRRFILSC
ncbi:MAG: glutamate--tRNA ligase [Candidatus Micrarchaeota archaeon]